MKILTVGASPYLLTRNGRMNSDVLRYLKSKGHKVVSAVWHHDEGYFMPDDSGIHVFEHGGKPVCNLFPFSSGTELSAPQVFEIAKKAQPDVVITIGDYKDTSFFYAIKAMHPNLFKWVAVLTIDCLWVNPLFKESIEYADFVISTSEFGFADVSNLCNINGQYLPYGPNHEVFNSINRISHDTMTVLNASKNAQSTNLGAFIKSMGEAKSVLSLNEETILGKIHTNMYDPGDYDFNLLIERYEAGNVSLPTVFTSIKDGPADSELADIYRSSEFFVDCSVKSATGIGMLEAMACGCVPIGMDSGRIGEIISQMPEEFMLFAPYETYIGASEEEYSVISIQGLTETIIDAKHRLFDKPENFEKASEAAKEVAKKYSNTHFLEGLIKVVEGVASKENEIALETFE